MAYLYARDLDPSIRNDAFMGEGFEEAMKNAEEHDEDLIIGEFYKNSEWRSN